MSVVNLSYIPLKALSIMKLRVKVNDHGAWQEALRKKFLLFDVVVVIVIIVIIIIIIIIKGDI